MKPNNSSFREVKLRHKSQKYYKEIDKSMRFGRAIPKITKYFIFFL